MTLDEYKTLVTQQRNAQQQNAINAINTIKQSTIKQKGNK
jgi:hypothetical protein